MIFQLDEIALLRGFVKISSFGFVEIVLEWITSTKMEMNKYLEVIFGMLAAGRFKNFDSHWLKTGARRNRTMFQNLPLLSLTHTHTWSHSLCLTENAWATWKWFYSGLFLKDCDTSMNIFHEDLANQRKNNPTRKFRPQIAEFWSIWGGWEEGGWPLTPFLKSFTFTRGNISEI